MSVRVSWLRSIHAPLVGRAVRKLERAAVEFVARGKRVVPASRALGQRLYQKAGCILRQGRR